MEHHIYAALIIKLLLMYDVSLIGDAKSTIMYQLATCVNLHHVTLPISMKF